MMTMAAPPSFQPVLSQPTPATPPQPPVAKQGFSTPVLAGAVIGAFVLGVLVAVAAMWVLLPHIGPVIAPVASSSASTETTEAVPATASAPSYDPSTTAAAPAIDPAAAARARKLAELRKKIKGKRARQLDGQCKQLKKTFQAGYVYDGGTFAENEMVANASGCVALAKASKAPWFCCRK
jgi:hypothetical protein